jgi:multidrug resistance protein, MATE family
VGCSVLPDDCCQLYLCGDAILSLFTKIPSVIELANIYGIWLILFPLSASVGIVFYGVFTGATEAAPIRNSMIYSLIAFVITLYIFVPAYQNHALWLAFTVFSLGRSVFLALYIPRLSKKLFPNRSVRLENDQMV